VAAVAVGDVLHCLLAFLLFAMSRGSRCQVDRDEGVGCTDDMVRSAVFRSAHPDFVKFS